MNKLIALIFIILGFYPFTWVKAQKSVQEKPNIVIIFFDDLGYGDLGAYGNPTIKTPNMDRMAEEGMKFTQFYAAASVCTPSRAGLLTGRIPLRMGMMSYENRVLFANSTKGLPLEDLTIAEELKQERYATAAIGKWHLGNHSPYLPTDRGFDYYYGLPYSNDMQAGRQKHTPELPLIRNKKVIEQPVNQKTLTKRYTEEAKRFIQNNKDNPFFLYFPHTFPHVPLHASEQFRGTSARGLYGDVVEELDWSVGQVLDELKKTGQAENTLVFLTSDNGPWWNSGYGKKGGSSGLLRGGKGSTWEGGMRVPAIAWWPGTVKSGEVTQTLASGMDLFSTSLALADVPSPSNRTIDGVNLMPLLTGKKEKVRDYVWFYRGDELYAVRSGPWKLEMYTQPGYSDKRLQNTGSNLKYVKLSGDRIKHNPPLLFNLNEDPSEKWNVAEKHPEVVSRIMKAVKKHMKNFDLGPDKLAPRINKSTLLEGEKE